ncbi:MAG: hypothetical protein K2G01_07730 [Paramuribaculum sp.]|nr:hypothetical protein [Paramuribaculum sp.]
MHTRLTLSFFILATAAGASLASCSNRKTDCNADLISSCDSIPQPVKSVVRAIAGNDSTAFSELVSYPLARPYPLHDIAGPEEMKGYFHILADDSLRNIITTATPADWSDLGWRGWTVDDGSYVWIDEKLYDIPYISSKEQKLLDSLVAAETGSLAPELRPGWTPVLCLKAESGNRVMRIDENINTDSAPLYRLAVYESPSAMRSMPALLLTGYKTVEGSAGVTTYSFASPDGTKAVYQADIMDDSAPAVIFTSPSGSDSTVAVGSAYWLSLLPPCK